MTICDNLKDPEYYPKSPDNFDGELGAPMQFLGCMLLEMALRNAPTMGETQNGVVMGTMQDSTEINPPTMLVDSNVDCDGFIKKKTACETKAEADDNSQTPHVEDSSSPKPRFGKDDDPLATLAEITRTPATVLPEVARHPCGLCWWGVCSKYHR